MHSDILTLFFSTFMKRIFVLKKQLKKFGGKRITSINGNVLQRSTTTSVVYVLEKKEFKKMVANLVRFELYGEL